MHEVLKHVAWIIWSTRAVAHANRRWRDRKPYVGDTLMDVGGLNLWLYRWAVETGRLPDDGGRPGLYSQRVSQVFDVDPEAVKEEARNYWRLLVDDHTRE